MPLASYRPMSSWVLAVAGGNRKLTLERDQFLAEQSQLGKGTGSAMIRAFLTQVFSDPAVTVVQTDPSPTNLRAVRCYKRSGFQEVGLVSTPDGLAMLMRCTRQSLSRASHNAA
jgi:aminoglycoside 6'-N-acetyltransferase Ib